MKVTAQFLIYICFCRFLRNFLDKFEWFQCCPVPYLMSLVTCLMGRVGRVGRVGRGTKVSFNFFHFKISPEGSLLRRLPKGSNCFYFTFYWCRKRYPGFKILLGLSHFFFAKMFYCDGWTGGTG